MKTQMKLLCFAVVTLLAEAQLPAQLLENFRFPLDNYRPLMDQLQIETVSIIIKQTLRNFIIIVSS